MTSKKTLKELRLEKSYSIRDLAKEAGISPTTILSIELGNASTLRTRRLLAKALCVEPSSISW